MVSSRAEWPGGQSGKRDKYRSGDSTQKVIAEARRILDRTGSGSVDGSEVSIRGILQGGAGVRDIVGQRKTEEVQSKSRLKSRESK